MFSSFILNPDDHHRLAVHLGNTASVENLLAAVKAEHPKHWEMLSNLSDRMRAIVALVATEQRTADNREHGLEDAGDIEAIMRYDPRAFCACSDSIDNDEPYVPSPEVLHRVILMPAAKRYILYTLMQEMRLRNEVARGLTDSERAFLKRVPVLMFTFGDGISHTSSALTVPYLYGFAQEITEVPSEFSALTVEAFALTMAEVTGDEQLAYDAEEALDALRGMSPKDKEGVLAMIKDTDMPDLMTCSVAHFNFIECCVVEDKIEGEPVEVGLEDFFVTMESPVRAPEKVFLHLVCGEAYRASLVSQATGDADDDFELDTSYVGLLDQDTQRFGLIDIDNVAPTVVWM